ncbi:MAG: elongation factor Ts, partial [Limisphaerales bacterium]
MAITAALVKELRERTGLGMMDCKKALEETDGDLELAIEELRKKSSLKAAKKAGRTTADGLLGLKVAEDGSRGAIIEVNIETDFAAKNEKFIAFVAKTLDAVFESDDGQLATVMAAGLDAERETLVQEIGENVSVRRA